MRPHKYKLGKVKLRIEDAIQSAGSDIVADELSKDEYGLDNIDFKQGDVVVDIGGHVGTFAIYLAKRFPFLKIISYEPLPINHENFVKNIALNEVANVSLRDLAVTGDGRRVKLLVHASNTAGATSNIGADELRDHLSFEVGSVKLDDIISSVTDGRIKLLKVDCEGSEYEVLLNSQLLERVEYLSAEFHINSPLTRKGYTVEQLVAYCERYIDPKKIVYKTINMQEV